MRPALTGTLVDFRPRTLLHFLGLTGKSGVLRVDDVTVAFSNGRVVGPDATDAVVTMLRTPHGRFRFEEAAAVEDPAGRAVEDLLAEAGEVIMDWEEVAQVVPSMSVVVTLCDGPDAEVRLAPDAWTLATAVAAVAAGHATPSALAAHLGWPALRVCRAVTALVACGRAAVSPPPRDRRSRLSGRAGAVVTGRAEPALWPGQGESESYWRTPWHDVDY